MAAANVLTTSVTGSRQLVTVDGQTVDVTMEPAGSGVIPPLYSVVLAPGSSSTADNVFTSWPALYAACSGIQGGVRVVGNDSGGPIHIPAGAWDINNWRFDSEASFTNPTGGAVFNVDDGATFVPGPSGNLAFTLGPWTVFTAAATTTAPITLATGEVNVTLEHFSAIDSTGAHPFFNVTGALAAAFLWLHLQNASLGDSAHAVISLAAGAGGQINMTESEIHVSALAGAGIAGLEVFVGYDSNVESPNGAANLQWGTLNENAGTQGLLPTVVAGAAAGVGAVAAIAAGSNDTAGSITITPAGVPAAGIYLGFNVARAFNSAPRAILLFPMNAPAASVAANIFVSGVSATTFLVESNVALTAGTAYQWSYLVLE